MPTEPAEYAFDAQQVSSLYASTADAETPAVDAQTWRDLMADRYLARLSDGASLLGQQVLYRRLRAGLDDAACREHADRITALSRDGGLLRDLGAACAPLRGTDADIARSLFAPDADAGDHWCTHAFGLVGPAFLLALALTFVWPAAWAPAGILFALLLVIRLRYMAAVRACRRAPTRCSPG